MTFLGIVVLLRSLKFCFSISVTILGITTCVKFLQPEKTKSPILVIILEIVIEVKFLQSLNASLPISVTLLGIMIEVNL